MTADSERRQGPDRRKSPRGGRRATDQPGYSPLVLVVDVDPRGRETCETILAKLRFAVAPVDSAEKALDVMAGLRPDVIVTRERDAERLRQNGGTTPVVVSDRLDDPERLVGGIRRPLRARPAPERKLV